MAILVSDSASAVIAWPGSVTDAVSIGDSVSIDLVFDINVTDNVIVQSQLQSTYFANVTDAVTVGEAHTLAEYPIKATFTESVTIGEVASPNLRSFFSVTDPITVTDSPSSNIAWQARVTDALTIGDTVQTPLPGTIQRNVTDAVTIGETATLSLSTPTNFRFYKILTIRSGQVPSVQGNFAVLLPFISGDNDMRSTANGGHVTNTNGYDIRPYTDATFSTPLSYELVTDSYDPVQGSFTMWVNITAQDGAQIYLAYGNPLIVNDGSSPSTWDSHYQGVFHLASGVGGQTFTVESGGTVVPMPEVGLTDVNVTDSSNMGIYTGVNHGVTQAVSPVGPVGNFMSVESQYVGLGGTGTHNTSITVAAWILLNATGSTMHAVSKGAINTTAPDIEWQLYYAADGHLVFAADNGTLVGVISSSTLSAHQWYRVYGVYDGTSWSIYINGLSAATPITTSGPIPTASEVEIGALPINVSSRAFYWDGGIGEVSIANVARLADWIKTDYNNQSSLVTFWITGAETNVGSIAVTDGTTVTDTPTIHLQSYVNPVELVTIGEVVALAIPVNPSVTDPITIGESASINILTSGKVNVTDQVSMGESVNLSLVPVLLVAAVDTATIGEDPRLSIAVVPVVVDAVQLSEAVSLLVYQPGQTVTVSVTDPVTLADGSQASIVSVTHICIPFRGQALPTSTARANAVPVATIRPEAEIEECETV